MVNVGLPVREVPVHGYSVKDEHSADEKDADPLEPPGKVSPAEEISLYKGGPQPQQDGIDKGLQLPGLRKMEGEDRNPCPFQRAGRTDHQCQCGGKDSLCHRRGYRFPGEMDQ